MESLEPNTTYHVTNLKSTFQVQRQLVLSSQNRGSVHRYLNINNHQD